MIGVFDIFKIGIGPSSSHTLGPMRAAKAFVDGLRADGRLDAVERVHATLFGSLAWTGKGHATDKAVVLGLAGLVADTLDPDEAERFVRETAAGGRLQLPGGPSIAFDPKVAIGFDRTTPKPFHPNALGFAAYDKEGELLGDETWYSIGGGFVVREGEGVAGALDDDDLPFPFTTAAELLAMADGAGWTITDVQLANEVVRRPRADVMGHVDRVAEVMLACIERGLQAEGELPGGLRVKRRAPGIFARVRADRFRNTRAPNDALDYPSVFAIAVNEENAAGGRVVTAPTNGAAGVVPSVLRYYRDFCPGATPEGMQGFLVTAAAIGGLFARNASISGAEVGCQGEVGVACSMAAAGLTAALGGTNAQIENAAEIGMEHHLGMTCDPVGGLVQIPCIERNAFGAVKAINASSLALRGDGTHRISLDQVIATMRQTGADMQTKYKETSLGGLAVNFTEC